MDEKKLRGMADHDLLVEAVTHIGYIRAEAAEDRKEIKSLARRVNAIETECEARSRVNKALCQAKKQGIASRAFWVAVAGMVIAGISVVVNLILKYRWV